MNIEDIKNIEIVATSNNVQKILPFDKRYVFPQKIDKTIEIVIVPKLDDITINQRNVAITLDENLILEILSRHYRNVLITKINTENDLKKLALRKPDLVFSGVKYFYFDGKIIWLNDHLEIYDIPYIASNREALHNEHDKSIAKKIIQNANIKTADFFTTEHDEYPTEMSIPIAFPLFIKKYPFWVEGEFSSGQCFLRGLHVGLGVDDDAQRLVRGRQPDRAEPFRRGGGGDVAIVVVGGVVVRPTVLIII